MHTQSETMWEWPCKLRLGYPKCVSSRVRFQIIRVLSRLPERSMLGFSKLVASEVTQPLWPSSVPRITNCSAMLGWWRTWSEDGFGWLHFQILVGLV